jgi:hypothetical protein
MIEAALTIFAAQAAMVFLLGFQSLSVQGRHYVLASIGSLLLGVTGFTITSIIAQMGAESVGTLVWWAFIAAGPVGITASMYLHPRIKRALLLDKSQVTAAIKK